jgi:hypothetical protein
MRIGGIQCRTIVLYGKVLSWRGPMDIRLQ